MPFYNLPKCKYKINFRDSDTTFIFDQNKHKKDYLKLLLKFKS